MPTVDNKVHYGLTNVYYAPLTETADPVTGEITASYGTPIRWPGAVSIDLSANMSQDNFYADNGVYYVTSSDNNYEGDYESASVPRQFKKDIFGDIEDDNGALVEISGVPTRYFALLIEHSGDVGGQRQVFYKCSATRPNQGSATTEDGVEVQTQTVTITAIPMAQNVTIGEETGTHPIQAFLNKGDTGYSTFFDSVYLPVSSNSEAKDSDSEG